MSWATPVVGRHTITARFGERGAQWSSGSHTGLDFAAPSGTQAVAVDDGLVIFASYSGRYGNLVKIRHSGVDSWYAHLSSFDVRMLQRVKRGAPVGKVGSTGNATGPHLHLEARVAGNPVDPERYLSGTATGTGGPIGEGLEAGVGLLFPGATEAFEALAGVGSALGNVVGFVTDARNWQRVALFIGGGVLILVGLGVAAKKGIT